MERTTDSAPTTVVYGASTAVTTTSRHRSFAYRARRCRSARQASGGFRTRSRCRARRSSARATPESEPSTARAPPTTTTASVVVGGARAVEGSDSGVARAEERRALQRDRVRKPPLACRAERQRRARYAKDLWRDVVVTAVEAPYTTVVGAESVVLSIEQAPSQDIFESVGARTGDLDGEIIEWTLIGIVGLSRQPIVHRKVHLRLVAPELGRCAGLVLRGGAHAEREPAVVNRIVAWEDGLEAIAEGVTVEAHRRRNERGAHFAPEAGHGVSALEEQVRHPEQRFAEEGSGDAARDLIVAGRRRRLTRDLPERAARKSVCRRFPEIEARGARESVIHRSLIRMPELVGRERIVVDDPAVMQIAADRREVRVVILASGVPVGQIQQDVETDDLERRKKVTLARLDIRRKIGLGLPRNRLQRIVLQRRP